MREEKKLQELFYPKSVAVVGISERKDNLARNIAHNLISWEYQGDMHLVNPKGGFTFDRPIYKKVMDIPSEVDLAAILTPAGTVPQVLRDCGEKGIRYATISTGGFSELDEGGASLIKEVKEVGKKYNIRFVGPNGIAVINTEIGLCLPFARIEKIPPGGEISVLAQSGGIGLSIMILLANEKLRINKFVSLGNKDDLDEVDFLRYLKDDEKTKVIILYLESIKRGKELLEILKEINKPVIFYKSNTGGASAEKAALSHTAALTTDDKIIEAMCKQSGVIRVNQMHHIAKLAKMFVSFPPLRGNKVMTISLAGGWAVISADCAEKNGFELPEISEKTSTSLQEYTRAGVIRFSNPLDLGDAFSPQAIFRSFALSLEQENIDAVVSTFFVRKLSIQSQIVKILTDGFGEVLRDLIKKYNKPFMFCLVSDGETYNLINDVVPIPIFPNPEEVFELLARYRDYFLRDRTIIPPKDFEVNKDRVREILKKYTRGKIKEIHSFEILSAYGIKTPEMVWIKDESMLEKVKDEVKYPQVMKIYSPDVLHKTEVGGIKVGISNKEEFKKCYYEILENVKRNLPTAKIEGIISTQMVEGGKEVILGVKKDSVFGPVLMFGLGGIYVEVMKDVSFRLIPFTQDDAENIIREVRSSSLLYGQRGEKPSDISYLKEVMFRLSQLVRDFPEIEEIDLNPLMVKEEGQKGSCVDVRIIVGK